MLSWFSMGFNGIGSTIDSAGRLSAVSGINLLVMSF